MRGLVRKRLLKRKKRIGLVLLLCFMVFGCSGSPPEILDVYYQINMVRDPDSNRIDQTLSLFILPDDPDGLEDLDVLYLMQDDKELYWTLRSEEWQDLGDKAQNWIGSNTLSMPDGSDLPAGEYRILLKDLSGQAAERQFQVPIRKIKRDELSFPVLTLRGDRLFVEGSHGDNQIVVYERGGGYKLSMPSSGEGIARREINSKGADFSSKYTYFVYTYDEPLDLGLISGPYSF
ncbi:MAG TPA: hypothetical protein VMX75_16345 [Spirochaetia bacterium]|nr:hypothetical protein [Spirochaetia bacterium]